MADSVGSNSGTDEFYVGYLPLPARHRHNAGVMTDTTFSCTRCNRSGPALEKPPFPNAIGQRIQAGICQPCWKEWLQKQNQLMNHFGLNTMDPDHRQMLLDNLKGFLFNEGPMSQIDSALEGTITHISK